MIWVAWRQYRLELIMGLVLLTALAAFLVPTGIQQVASFSDSGLTACLNAGAEDCAQKGDNFIDDFRSLNQIVQWFLFVPAIIGVLLAAPIVMELEQRTCRLAWTQSITRWRWLATKLGLALLAAVAFSLMFTLLMTWWFAPQDRLQDPFATSFYFKGAMPFVYTVFALAVALTVGALSKRTIPAVLVTLLVFFVAQLSIGNGLRQHYLEPTEQITAVNGVSATSLAESNPQVIYEPDRDWTLSNHVIDGAGNYLTDLQLQEMCGSGEKQVSGSANNQIGVGLGWLPCLESHGVRNVVISHPADRFWTFQGIEAAIYLGAAIPLLGLTVWVVSQRMR
ncbi:MAG: ABC transporter permease subunit [Chloroflexi bacterium]|nr:ABC transporter permease subunit [Chloroflexota bacterium]